MKPTVIYTDWGVGSRTGNTIELHKDLILYPELHDAILKHELEHTSKDFSMDDFIHDAFPNDKINRWELFKFWIVRPKCWIALLPFYWFPGKGFVIDLNRTIIYSIIAFVFAVDAFWIIKLMGGI